MADLERHHHVSLKFKHIKVQVISGLFYNEQTDVVVNSTSLGLRLSDGQGSKALLEAAGSQIQQDVSAKHPNGIEYGEIAVSGGHNLYCSLVFHCSLKRWAKGDQDDAEKVLKQIVSTSLQKAHDKDDVHSITFPGLGRGFNNFPAKNVANIMFQCVADFEEDLSTEPTVKDVRFLIYPADEEAIEAFIDEAKQRSKSVITSMEYSVNFGSLKVTLLQGDITKQMCDVVINESFENLDLSKSPISKAAGPGLEQSLKNTAGDELGYGQLAITGNADLTNCKTVYHGAFPPYTKQTETDCRQVINLFIMQCLMQAAESNFMVMSLPPLGTDLKNYPPEISAEAIQGSIIEYLSTNSDTVTLKHIYIIVQPSASKTFKAFKDKMFPYIKGQQRLDRTLQAKPSKRPSAAPPPNVMPLNLFQVAPRRPPARGTMQWLHKMYEDQPLTPQYWTYFTGGQRVRKLKVDPAFASKKSFKLVDVDPKTFQAIRCVVQKTWKEDFFSHGRDAVGLGDLNYNKIKITEVKRLENLNLFEKYSCFRQQMFGKVLAQQQVFTSIDELKKSKGGLLTSSHIDPCLTKDIYPEVNEHYVFHGTKQENIEIILATGLDSRMTGPNAMFGQGVYGAESSTKADQYTDYRDRRDMKPKNMFLTRMCMGDVCLVDKPLPMKRPPCKSCMTTICDKECRNTKLFDSVLVDGQWIFREMVVYDHSQCYPEFLITYQRVK